MSRSLTRRRTQRFAPPLALTRRGRNFLIAAAGLMLLWLMLGLRDIWYLIALLIGLVIAAGLTAIVLPLFAQLRVSLSVSEPTPIVGSTPELTAIVRHRLSFTLYATVVWRMSDTGEHDEHETSPVLVLPRQQSIASTVWKPMQRGPARVQVAAVMVVDPLGLIQRRIRVPQLLELLVLPKPLIGLTAPTGTDETDSSDWSEARLLHAQHSGSPGGAVREYRRGDTPRQIHWKQSARQGELLVNLYEHNTRSERSLLLNDDARAYQPASRFELAVSAAAALTEHWIGDGHLVRLWVDDGPPHVCTSQGQALRVLAEAQLGAAGQTALDSRRALPAVVVTGGVTPALSERLRQEPHGGDVYVLREADTGVIAGQWNIVTIAGGRGGGSSA